ncbi:radical SAM protein [Phocaeicola plebeius]|uniref:radical SAM/SPASM domain-containing protein n=1 Tax=Phocaeicola plebeius TaxID=310297 RepID=UPI0026EB70C3|nr:radical SAM protein [Phocaeicola plebeius]
MVSILSKDDYLNNFIIESYSNSDAKKYKWSDFNVIRIESSETLVYNTFSKSLVLLSWDIRHRQIEDLRPDEVQILYSCNIIVNIDLDEQVKYWEIHHLLRQIEYSTHAINRYNILTTTGCNARCFYCFEDGVDIKTMSSRTAEQVATYIYNNSLNTEMVELRWFGGEPLVNYKAIDIICSNLQKMGQPFYSTISSNGTLIGLPHIYNSLKKWNFKKVRLSFDGLKEEHNRRKNYPSIPDAYTVTLENVDKLIAIGVETSIRLTFDENNLNDIFKVAEMLIKRYKDNKLVKVYSRCIFEKLTTIAANNNLAQVKKLVEFKEFIDSLLFKNGLYDETKWQPIGYQPSFCAANNPNAVVIDPMGRLTSCETITPNTQFWGDITNGVTDDNEKNRWIEITPIKEKCKTCHFLPSCTTFSLCPNDYYDCIERANNSYQNYLLSEFLKLSPRKND